MERLPTPPIAPRESGFRWPNGCRAAVSLSFDDARDSQLDCGIPILDARGVKATFYVSLNRLTERPGEWRRVADAGHEIGNHSLRHACSGNFVWKTTNVLERYTLEQMEDEVLQASQTIETTVGTRPVTFAYPCGQTFVGRGTARRSYVPVIAEHFRAGRGFREEFLNRPEFCDLAILGGTELDGLAAEDALAVIERAAANGQWVIFVGHEVRGSGRQAVDPAALARICETCTNPANRILLDTVAAVAACVEENREPPQ